ncbi:MAG TPA: hypothetical protein VFL45_00705 [Gammaproteobacteria bacterium]|nr:hypothetical protein [Gammaproteobacteria bacterium]
MRGDQNILTSAPGKLVLLGEYAVLEGAPALVMAVNRRARVTLTDNPDGDYVIDAPSLDIRNARGRLANDRINWPDLDAADAEKLQLAGAVIAAQATEAPLPPFRASLDTDAFFTGPGGSKLGLGSSAALTVALAGAVRVLSRTPVPQAESLINIHRQVQDGRGSGLDIAASLHGGVIEYRLDEGRPRIESLRLPAGLEVACVWSGQSASTGAFLGRVAGWRERAPVDYAALMEHLTSCAAAGASAARDDDAAAFMDTAQAYAAGLAELGRASGAGIITPEHVKISSIAADCGVTYKTCGAGGGDIGIAFATDPDRLAFFRRQLAEAGFQALDLMQDSRGLRAD